MQDNVDALNRSVGVVVVDLVKAALQLVLAVHADNAVDAAQQALHTAARSLCDGGLSAPGKHRDRRG